MKRLLSVVFVGMAAVLAGCPIYSDAHTHRVCNGSSCYDCPDDFYSSSCTGWQCNSNYDCPGGYACSNGACTSNGQQPPTGNPTTCSSPSDCASGQNCGSDGVCHSGDCSNSGCPSGYVCELANGQLACVAGGTTGGKDGGTPFMGCTSDASCVNQIGNGAKCLDGACVAPPDQCSDATQCPNAEQCVQGVCTPSCDGSHPCPTGYACDTSKGVCTGNPTPCGSGGSACSGGTTCVDQRCVTPCGANNSCASGLICVDGGCIPDQKPTFVCSTEGVQDACASGSVCLHHNCYIACAGDAGAGACAGADRYNQCKSVTTSTGTYNVCGSTTNLGSDCDPTQGKNCAAGQICIDGYCR